MSTDCCVSINNVNKHQNTAVFNSFSNSIFGDLLVHDVFRLNMYRIKSNLDDKKKDVDMIFNIQWKNKTVCVDARSNMVGMLDGSAITDYRTFKSYLLNNSGTFVNNVDNVRVSFIVGDNECYIDNDFDYNYALPLFRMKATTGQYIDLRLDYVDRSNIKDKEIPPPDWFLKYMKKFKEEIVSEISGIVMSKQHQSNSHPIRKLKPDSYKRNRKVPLLVGDTNDRELLTKVRTKLEKLEHKATKIKTKKALMGLSSDSDAGKSSKSETNQPRSVENDVEMSAILITPTKKANIPYLSGGETYVHTWEVKNNGLLPWNSSTKLKYAWGSQAFEPWEKNISCPFLKPGDTGCISAIFNVPALPGMYECYWHFYNNGKRFGISLSSIVMIADNPVRAENYIRSPTYDVINIQDDYELVLPTTWTTPPQKRTPQSSKIESQNQTKSEVEKTPIMVQSSPIIESKDEADCIDVNQVVTNERENCDEFKGEGVGVENNDGSKISNDGTLEMENNNNESDDKHDFDLFLDESDDQSIISISDSSSSYNSKNEFVMLDSTSPTLEVNDMNQNGSTVADMNNLLVDAIQDASEISDIKLEHECLENKKEQEEEKKEELKSADITDNETNGASDVKLATQTVLENNDSKCDDKNNVEDVVKNENKQAEPEIEFGFVLYEGKIVRVPKRYLRDDKSLKEERVLKLGEITHSSDQNNMNLQKDNALKTENTNDIKTNDNGAVPKSTSNVKKEKIVKKIKPTESKNVDTITKGLKLQENRRSYPEMYIRRNSKESTSDKQRFFVFPQQGSGYEMVDDSKYGDYYLKTQFDESSGIINMYILYFKTHSVEPGVYGYLLPLEYVQDHALKKSSPPRDDQVILYAVPIDVEALFKAKTIFYDAYCEYRYILMKLHHGPHTEDTGKVWCDDPYTNTQHVYHLGSLKAHLRSNAASIDKQYRCVVHFGQQSMVVYEMASISRRYATDVDIKPQIVIPESNLQLHIKTLRTENLCLKNRMLTAEGVQSEYNIYNEIQLGKRETLSLHKKCFDHTSGIVNMFILYYFDYKIEPDLYAYFVPLEYVQVPSVQLPADSVWNKNELIFYSVPVDLEALLYHHCDDVMCKAGICNSNFILIPLNMQYSEYMSNNNLYPVWKNSLYTLTSIKSYFVYYVDGHNCCVVSPSTGQKYIVYAIYSLERQAACDMNIRPQEVTDIMRPEKLLKLCIYAYEPKNFQNCNKTQECSSGTRSQQGIKLPSEIKETVALTNEVNSSETVAIKPVSASVQNLKGATTNGSGNGKKKHESARSNGNSDGAPRFSGIISGLRGKMGGIRNSVIDTAKDIVDIVTLPNQSNIGYWLHGHWISTNHNSKREQALQVLQEMGFSNRDYNATLLGRYGDDVNIVLSHLLDYRLDV